MIGMVAVYEDGDRINLSPTDVRALVALLLGPMTGYEIARQCDKDGGSGYKISNGSIYRSLRSLEDSCLIEAIETNQAKRPGLKSKVYRLNEAGKGMLETHLRGWQELIKLRGERAGS